MNYHTGTSFVVRWAGSVYKSRGRDYKQTIPCLRILVENMILEGIQETQRRTDQFLKRGTDGLRGSSVIGLSSSVFPILSPLPADILGISSP
jgi:hypothetical protein